MSISGINLSKMTLIEKIALIERLDHALFDFEVGKKCSRCVQSDSCVTGARAMRSRKREESLLQLVRSCCRDN